MKRIVLCADDFGQSAPICDGILQLVRLGRLSAVSCLTDGDAWREHGATLAKQRDVIDIGLHFNLTHPFPTQQVAARPLGAVLVAALSGRLGDDAIARALHAQLDRFEEIVGGAPHFVDGHQHVHMFPGIRGALLRELGRRYTQRKPYLRHVDPRLPNPMNGAVDALKTAVLKSLNVGFARAAARRGLTCTQGFGGIYSLRPSEDFAALMQGWLAQAHGGDLLMCHPGLAANDATDPIAATRPRELQHLASPEFAAQLRAADVILSRFGRL